MRIGYTLLAKVLTGLALACFQFKASALGSADGAAIQYHFVGATALEANTNFFEAKHFLTSTPGQQFQNYVLERLATVYAKGLQLEAGSGATNLLVPLLNDLLQVESFATFGGHDANRLDFVLAARLDDQRAAEWQKNLETMLHGKGAPLSQGGFSGERWDLPGGNSFWILRAGDWIVTGRGESLLPVRADYLQQIKQDNHPAPTAKENWFTALVDWPLLVTWVPLPHAPLKLARTSLEVAAHNGRMRATVHVSYPEAISWKPEPWRIPKGLVDGPLSSFCVARNVAPFLNSNDLFSHLSNNPLAGELYCWALRAVALQTYAAWPVVDATNAIQSLGKEVPPLVNPILTPRDNTQLKWNLLKDQIAWDHLPLTGPVLEPEHDTSGDFLMAKLFPLEAKRVPAPSQLWSQFEGHDDLVYYDWELTGLRLRQWRLLSELLPILPQVALKNAPAKPTPQNPKPQSNAKLAPVSLVVTESWLASLVFPPANTVTEVTRTSPTELTVVRNSPYLFTAFEWVMLSHWLADAPVGPPETELLPNAKITGPGMPHPR